MEERIINNRYVINGVIGSGGMSMVYKGFCMDTGLEVAVKMLRPEYLEDQEFVRRFKKEASIASAIQHRHIVNSYDVGEEEGVPFIVMEYVRGKTLKELIEERGVLTPTEAVDIAVKICSALYYAHGHHLVHRDIKPQNILLGPNGVVKVGDFGIAKIANSATATISGSNVMGSVHYISPEQARGTVTDEKSDIYSLGIVLYEMLTGVVPFKGDTPVAVAIKHLSESIVPPRQRNPQVTIALEEIIMKATSKTKEVRYDDAEEFSRDLERALREPDGGFVVMRDMDVFGGTKEVPVITPEIMAALNQTMGQQQKRTQPPVQSAGRRNPKRHYRGRVAFSIVRIILGLLVVAGLLVSMFLIALSIYRNNLAPEQIEVPQLQGMTLELALNELQQQGFKADVIKENHSSVSEGMVFYQDPLPETLLQEGDVVQIKVSLGPAMGFVPDVVDTDLTEAAKMIEDVGFEVGDVIYELSDKPKDYVIRQEPAAGEEVPLEEKINLWLAQHPDMSLPKMPAVVSLNQEQAVGYITALGHEVDKIIEVNSNEPSGTVVKQFPDEGEEVTPETEIKIWVSNGLGGDYVKRVNILLAVPEDNTRVEIKYIDQDIESIVYNQELDKGDHELTIELKSKEIGEKAIIIYYNGEEQYSDRITFDVGEG